MNLGRVWGILLYNRSSELHRHQEPHSTPSSATKNLTALIHRQQSQSHTALLTTSQGLKNSSPGISDTAKAPHIRAACEHQTAVQGASAQGISYTGNPLEPQT